MREGGGEGVKEERETRVSDGEGGREDKGKEGAREGGRWNKRNFGDLQHC